MNITRRTTARLLSLAAFAMVAASGCLLQLPAPEINLLAEPAYNDQEILIPYELYGEGRYARARWTLSVFTGVEFEEIESREIRIPSGSSGVLQLGELPELRFRIDFELLTTRDGSYEPVPYMTKWAEFVVDRTPPDILEVVFTPQGGAVTPEDETVDAFLLIEYIGTFDPAFESEEYVYAVVGEIRPPVADEQDRVYLDTLNQATLQLWSGSAEAKNVPVTVVLVDQAGNRSDPWHQTFTAP